VVGVISGRLRLERPHIISLYISGEAIYIVGIPQGQDLVWGCQWLYKAGNEEYKKYLAKGNRKPKSKRGVARKNRAMIKR